MEEPLSMEIGRCNLKVLSDSTKEARCDCIGKEALFICVNSTILYSIKPPGAIKTQMNYLHRFFCFMCNVLCFQGGADPGEQSRCRRWATNARSMSNIETNSQ